MDFVDNIYPKLDDKGVRNNPLVSVNGSYDIPKKPFVNPYKNGLPGSLIT